MTSSTLEIGMSSWGEVILLTFKRNEPKTVLGVPPPFSDILKMVLFLQLGENSHPPELRAAKLSHQHLATEPSPAARHWLGDSVRIPGGQHQLVPSEGAGVGCFPSQQMQALQVSCLLQALPQPPTVVHIQAVHGYLLWLTKKSGEWWSNPSVTRPRSGCWDLFPSPSNLGCSKWQVGQS